MGLDDVTVNQDELSVLSDCDSHYDIRASSKKFKSVATNEGDDGLEYLQPTELVVQALNQKTQMMSSDMKCVKFITENPVSAAFLKREKGRLPYSVFKASADNI
jgi:hypothetical protein